jgi:hypothetical protein
MNEEDRREEVTIINFGLVSDLSEIGEIGGIA